MTHEVSRSEGWGQRIINVVTSLAEDAGCEKPVLDANLANALARRFHVRQGMLSGARRFSRSMRKPNGQANLTEISVGFPNSKSSHPHD